MTLYDVSDATQTVYDAVGEDSETNIIFGAVTDASMNGKIRVTVIATGFNEENYGEEGHCSQDGFKVRVRKGCGKKV
jgi:cell division GTPase FtsZ